MRPEGKISEKPIKLQKKSTSLRQPSPETWTPAYSSGAVVSVSDTPIKIFSERPVRITKQFTHSDTSITISSIGTGRNLKEIFRGYFNQ